MSFWGQARPGIRSSHPVAPLCDTPPMPAEFELTDELQGARFTRVDLSGARFRDVNFSNVKIADSNLTGASLSGAINGLRINDVEVAPLIEAELDRRHPERARLRPRDPDGMRQAWSLIEELWSATMERAGRLPEAALHQRVDEEWSFAETLRHLIFVTDAWVSRTVLGQEMPFHPLGLWTMEAPGEADKWKRHMESLGIDIEARPSFEEVVAVRLERMSVVRGVVEGVTPGSTPAPALSTRRPVTPRRLGSRSGTASGWWSKRNTPTTSTPCAIWPSWRRRRTSWSPRAMVTHGWATTLGGRGLTPGHRRLSGGLS